MSERAAAPNFNMVLSSLSQLQIVQQTTDLEIRLAPLHDNSLVMYIRNNTFSA